MREERSDDIFRSRPPTCTLVRSVINTRHHKHRFTHRSSNRPPPSRRLKKILPSVTSSGVQLSIPMPGHPTTEADAAATKTLNDLIKSHTVTYLLTDTRESRWLPSVICASEGKVMSPYQNTFRLQL